MIKKVIQLLIDILLQLRYIWYDILKGASCDCLNMFDSIIG